MTGRNSKYWMFFFSIGHFISFYNMIYIISAEIKTFSLDGVYVFVENPHFFGYWDPVE